MLILHIVTLLDDICFLSNMMMINSPALQSDSDKRLCLTIPRTNKTDLLITPSLEKFDNLNMTNYNQEENSIDCNNIIKQQSLVSNDNENDTTLLTTTTTTTVEVKVKTTKTSSRKRKLNVINDMNNDNINKQQPVTKKKRKQPVIKIDDESSVRITSNNDKKIKNSKTIDQSSTTDESSFGSCEPGTSVVLQGIVWNETEKGVLVVNITWRGKTYVGALLNTTEQNWAPPRYKSDLRSIKHNHHRDNQLPSISLSQSSVLNESTERILRNGKRRGSNTTVTPTSTTKINSFKIPPTPPPSKNDEILPNIEKLLDNNNSAPSSSSTSVNDEDETNSINEEKTLIKNNGDDEMGDNCSSRSISPTTSGTSTTSSSPPLPSIPIDLSNSKNMEQDNPSSNSIAQQSFLSSFTTTTTSSKTKDTLIPYHFTNDMLFSSPTNPSSYFPSPSSYLHGSSNSFSLPSYQPMHTNNNKNNLSPTSSSSSSVVSSSIPPQLYFNSSHFSSVSSLSKSSH